MSKRLLSTALVAVLAAAGFAPSAQAATGTINISGKVLADTCTIAVNGGSTVTLPSVMKTAFTAVGSVAGATTFAVALTGCDTNATSATMQFSGSGIDTTTGNLKNTAASGSNVQVQLLNAASSDAVINTNTQANAPVIAIDSSTGAGTASLKAQYIATNAATTAGLVTSSVSFTLTYL
ncbi:fimbrial protein [Frateuria sp. GZRe12]|uniref:fimbrial protein n=1 Tax=Frateuria sp. GZRe12 TaxID=3351533 RepID=UPI003EDB87DF